MLSIERLSICFPHKKILNNITLNLQKGQCVGLLGANGAGKSTLLKSISQEVKYEGKIVWEHNNLADYSIPGLARVMGFLSQYNYLSFAFTAEEVVALGRMMYDTSNRENEKIVHKIMTDFGIAHLAKNNYIQLSGGEKQRVHAARVWAQLYEPSLKKSKLLLLDEPTSALDLKYQHSLLESANHYAKEDNLVIIIVHDLNLAARYCDKLLLLHEGELLAQGSPEQVLTEENIKTAYDYNAKIMEKDGYIMVW